MQLIEAFKLALQSLWGNKLRSILTLIGVVMGVASVIMVITLVNGANKYVSTKLSGYGADVFTVTRMPSVIFSGEEYLSYQKRKILRIEDYEDIKNSCTDCSEVGALLNKSTNVVANGHSSDNTSVRGYTYTMLSLNNIDIAIGRGFTPADEEHATKNVIVGYDIIDNLLGDGDPIGKEIRVDGVPYTIVGVGDRQGKTLGQSQDNWVAIPITTYEQIYGYNDSVDIYARANGNAEVMERAEDQVRVLMRTRHHEAPGQPDDFDLETNDTFLDIWKQISSLFAWVVLGLASIALVVGGVVIMNIMLVSVTERTREIGVRKALGAKQRDVLTQFLIESASLALIGGAIGVLGGILVGKLITLVVGFPTAVPLWAIFLGLFLAAAVGIFFGVYPASKAARLDPVVALRAEM
ncbi:MAG TPA: ABC transporter permease [Terracidiphilus sp.]|jgi:putative ABC transport system permease protein|nr:ABC transporter permease [Terracidiphilus sp.]